MSSPEVNAVLKECERRRRMEELFPQKSDSYHSLHILPVALAGEIKTNHGIDIMSMDSVDQGRLNSIVEREYSKFKCTNKRIG